LRAYLHEALQRYHEAYVAVPVGQFVDDTPQRREGTVRQLLLRMPAAMGALAASVQALGLTVSSKVVIESTSVTVNSSAARA